MANTQDLIYKINSKLKYLTIQDTKNAVDTIINYMTDSLAQQKRIEIRGFGSMSVRERAYANQNNKYNIIYYRMPQNLKYKINNSPNIKAQLKLEK